MFMQKPEGVKYWSLPAEDVLRAFDSAITGLTTAQADSRLELYGQNAIEAQRKTLPLLLFLQQFKNPIIKS
jgi:magnesium-transporting ATPase (P-type)